MLDVVTVVGVRAVHFVNKTKGLFCRSAFDSMKTEDDVREAVQSLVTPLNIYYPEEPFHGDWEYNFVIGDGILNINDGDEGRVYIGMGHVEDLIVEVKHNLWELCDEIGLERDLVGRQMCIFNIDQGEPEFS